VRQVAHSGLAVDDGLESGVHSHIVNALAVDPDLAPIAQPGAILFSGSDHACPLPAAQATAPASYRWMKERKSGKLAIASDRSKLSFSEFSYTRNCLFRNSPIME
jgi:hypothetical protein